MPLDVMIVDDSAATRKILQRVLVQAQVELGTVHEASNGREALDILKDVRVGLILSDINMRNMDGLELLGTLKADPRLNSVPFVVVTTDGSQAKVMQAFDLGASAYVRKPFTADQIKAKLVGIL